MNGHVVGIIGATSTALALARLASSIGIEVALADVPDAGQLGGLVHAVSIVEAADPEIVVLAADVHRIGDILEQVRNWDSRILVDATRAPGRQVVELSPGAQVIKAFGSSPISVFERPSLWSRLRHVIFMCGDHARAKVQFAGLLDRLEFLGIDLGSLDDGSRLLDPPNGALTRAALLAEARVF